MRGSAGAPEVSVVLGVYNGAAVLSETLDSVLSQQGVAFEIVAVDDGSTDATADILSAYAARDGRLRVLKQSNQGLTRALIRGCDEARGTFIARQDAGDISLPGRLATQSAQLRGQARAVVTSCATRIVGPKGEMLTIVRQEPGQWQHALEQLDRERPMGPSHHGATMFVREAYLAAGGYRAQFRVAQDIDLWSRMVEQGECLSDPKVLYEAKLIEGSISARKRRDQMRALDIVIACSTVRRHGDGDSELIGRLTESGGFSLADWRPDGLTAAEFNYFVGSMLRRSDPARANTYFRKGLLRWPLHLRSWVGWTRTLPKTLRKAAAT